MPQKSDTGPLLLQFDVVTIDEILHTQQTFDNRERRTSPCSLWCIPARIC